MGSEAIISSLATNWFPENQIGLALSFKTIGAAFGNLLGFLIPSQLFDVAASTSSNNDRNHSGGCTNVANNLQVKNWSGDVRSTFLILYGVLLLVCITIWVLVLGFVIEKPALPPTIAQALKPQQKRRKMKD